MLEMLEDCMIMLWDTYLPPIGISIFQSHWKAICNTVCGVISASLSSSFYHFLQPSYNCLILLYITQLLVC